MVAFPLSSAAATLDDVIAAVNELRYSFSGCKVSLNASQSIPNNAYTFVDFDTEIYDTDNYWTDAAYDYAAGTGPNFFTMPFDGWYQAVVSAYWNPNATGIRTIDFHERGPVLDGSIQTYNQIAPVVVQGVAHLLVTDFYAPAGQKVDINVYQDSGAALNLLGKVALGRHVTIAQFHYLGDTA